MNALKDALGRDSFVWCLGLIALGLLLAGLILWPDLDRQVANVFYDPASGTFPLRMQEGWQTVRSILMIFPHVVLAVLLIMAVVKLFTPRPLNAPSIRMVAHTTLTFALAPGLLVNGILKEISNRPRPVHVTDFGGSHLFKPFYDFSGACQSNCSFVSGEMAAATWLVVLASFAPSPMKKPLVVLTALIALFTGGLRMAFGGHFASDVILSSAFTLLIALVLKALMPGLTIPAQEATQDPWEQAWARFWCERLPQAFKKPLPKAARPD